jgi:hypothetical protein
VRRSGAEVTTVAAIVPFAMLAIDNKLPTANVTATAFLQQRIVRSPFMMPVSPIGTHRSFTEPTNPVGIRLHALTVVAPLAACIASAIALTTTRPRGRGAWLASNLCREVGRHCREVVALAKGLAGWGPTACQSSAHRPGRKPLATTENTIFPVVETGQTETRPSSGRKSG